ncbi:hypothetical protein MKW98_017041 [Papaver atlanticum]|uniref:MIP18 family-like domain-containing protein n=1 Tax=Papaver atlanticum TaxID=357466 RepID=A0AAD4TJR7_9MAGN|nr:hypothetical protein MKW98_017041 [Papaver atlanticum]
MLSFVSLLQLTARRFIVEVKSTIIIKREDSFSDVWVRAPPCQCESCRFKPFCYVQYSSFIFLTVLHHIRDIKDPEHPYSLEELKVVSEDAVEVNDKHSHVRVTFTPTVQHCSMATIIGLCLRVKLMRSLPPRYKVDIRVAPGTHATEAAVNKQLNDKERVAAALENPGLVDMVDQCLAPTYE